MKQVFHTLNKLPNRFALLLLFSNLGLLSCSSYRQNIMFKVDPGSAVQQAEMAEKNYVIQINDYLQLDVYTNKGERIIDPDLQLTKELGSQGVGQNRLPLTYLVSVQGIAKFPMIGDLKVEGLKLRDAEALLQKEYSSYYQGSFVVLKYMNKRVVVLGAPGGQVIPLVNENMKLVEVIALAKGISNDAKAQNIRILRQDKVFVADFSTINGYLKDNIVIEPGDIIYIEPVRRPFLEGLRDYGTVLSIITSLTTLAVVLIQLR